MQVDYSQVEVGTEDWWKVLYGCLSSDSLLLVKRSLTKLGESFENGTLNLSELLTHSKDRQMSELMSALFAAIHSRTDTTRTLTSSLNVILEWLHCVSLLINAVLGEIQSSECSLSNSEVDRWQSVVLSVVYASLSHPMLYDKSVGVVSDVVSTGVLSASALSSGRDASGGDAVSLPLRLKSSRCLFEFTHAALRLICYLRTQHSLDYSALTSDRVSRPSQSMFAASSSFGYSSAIDNHTARMIADLDCYQELMGLLNDLILESMLGFNDLNFKAGRFIAAQKRKEQQRKDTPKTDLDETDENHPMNKARALRDAVSKDLSVCRLCILNVNYLLAEELIFSMTHGAKVLDRAQQLIEEDYQTGQIDINDFVENIEFTFSSLLSITLGFTSSLVTTSWTIEATMITDNRNSNKSQTKSTSLPMFKSLSVSDKMLRFLTLVAGMDAGLIDSLTLRVLLSKRLQSHEFLPERLVRYKVDVLKSLPYIQVPHPFKHESTVQRKKRQFRNHLFDCLLKLKCSLLRSMKKLDLPSGEVMSELSQRVYLTGSLAMKNVSIPDNGIIVHFEDAEKSDDTEEKQPGMITVSEQQSWLEFVSAKQTRLVAFINSYPWFDFAVTDDSQSSLIESSVKSMSDGSTSKTNKDIVMRRQSNEEGESESAWRKDFKRYKESCDRGKTDQVKWLECVALLNLSLKSLHSCNVESLSISNIVSPNANPVILDLLIYQLFLEESMLISFSSLVLLSKIPSLTRSVFGSKKRFKKLRKEVVKQGHFPGFKEKSLVHFNPQSGDVFFANSDELIRLLVKRTSDFSSQLDQNKIPPESSVPFDQYASASIKVITMVRRDQNAMMTGLHPLHNPKNNKQDGSEIDKNAKVSGMKRKRRVMLQTMQSADLRGESREMMEEMNARTMIANLREFSLLFCKRRMTDETLGMLMDLLILDAQKTKGIVNGAQLFMKAHFLALLVWLLRIRNQLLPETISDEMRNDLKDRDLLDERVDTSQCTLSERTRRFGSLMSKSAALIYIVIDQTRLLDVSEKIVEIAACLCHCDIRSLRKLKKQISKESIKEDGHSLSNKALAELKFERIYQSLVFGTEFSDDVKMDVDSSSDSGLCPKSVIPFIPSIFGGCLQIAMEDESNVLRDEMQKKESIVTSVLSMWLESCRINDDDRVHTDSLWCDLFEQRMSDLFDIPAVMKQFVRDNEESLMDPSMPMSSALLCFMGRVWIDIQHRDYLSKSQLKCIQQRILDHIIRMDNQSVLIRMINEQFLSNDHVLNNIGKLPKPLKSLIKIKHDSSELSSEMDAMSAHFIAVVSLIHPKASEQCSPELITQWNTLSKGFRKSMLSYLKDAVKNNQDGRFSSIFDAILRFIGNPENDERTVEPWILDEIFTKLSKMIRKMKMDVISENEYLKHEYLDGSVFKQRLNATSNHPLTLLKLLLKHGMVGDLLKNRDINSLIMSHSESLSDDRSSSSLMDLLQSLDISDSVKFQILMNPDLSMPVRLWSMVELQNTRFVLLDDWLCPLLDRLQHSFQSGKDQMSHYRDPSQKADHKSVVRCLVFIMRRMFEEMDQKPWLSAKFYPLDGILRQSGALDSAHTGGDRSSKRFSWLVGLTKTALRPFHGPSHIRDHHFEDDDVSFAEYSSRVLMADLVSYVAHQLASFDRSVDQLDSVLDPSTILPPFILDPNFDRILVFSEEFRCILRRIFGESSENDTLDNVLRNSLCLDV